MGANPYEAPTAPSANPAWSVVSPVRRSRWTVLRWPPVVLCALTSAFCLLSGAYQIYLLIDLLVLGHQPSLLSRSHQIGLGALFPVALGLAALGLRTAHLWHRCFWKQASGFTLVFLVLGVAWSEYFDRFMPLTPHTKPAHRRGSNLP